MKRLAAIGMGLLAGLLLAASTSAGVAQSTKGVPLWGHWLCFPNHPNDVCYVDLTTTVVAANGSRRTMNVAPTSEPTTDCFYVYPTVSLEQRGNADLKLQKAEQDAAIIQAAQFSQVCRVFAPLYRQTTGAVGYLGDRDLAYADVLAAWKDYLAHDNGGRGVILIGHSQGTSVLERLIREQIDPSAARRKLLVSAILLGGAVSVADGSTVGGDFKHVPACTSGTETGCVIAYEAWDKTPPAGASYTASAHQHALCVNPGAPGSTRAAPITPIFAGLNSEGIAPARSVYSSFEWTEFPGRYTARCVQQGGRSWLLVAPTHVKGDKRPVVQEVAGSDSGLHPADVNIALANFITLVRSESRAFVAHR